MKRILAAVLLCALSNFTLAVDPVAVRALERDLAGQTRGYAVQAPKGNRRSGLFLTLAGLGMIGTGAWLTATSRQTELEYIPVSIDGRVVDSYTIEVEKHEPARLYGGMALAGGGGLLVWHGLARMK